MRFTCVPSVSSSASAGSSIEGTGAPSSTFTVATLTLWLFPIPDASFTSAYTVMLPERPVNAFAFITALQFLFFLALPSTLVSAASVTVTLPYSVPSSVILCPFTSSSIELIPAGTQPLFFPVSPAVPLKLMPPARFVYTVAVDSGAMSGTSVSTLIEKSVYLSYVVVVVAVSPLPLVTLTGTFLTVSTLLFPALSSATSTK